MAVVFLKPKRAKPFFYRHPWIYSGAVGRVEGDPEDGEVVEVRDSAGKFIAKGFYSPNSQIRVRLITWEPGEEVGESFFRERIRLAVELRSRVLRLDEQTNAYRVINSEGDHLAGLIVDKYGEFLVVQFLCSGVERRKEVIVGLLWELLSPKGIYERSDADVRAKEGLGVACGVLRGEAPPAEVRIEENGVVFAADIRHGQKTGFFFDQRDNRAIAATYARGKKVLDCFCYTGGFGIYAMKLGGAASLLGIDESERGIELARRNAVLNGLANVEFRVGNVFDELRDLRASGAKFQLVILDPPKFARAKAEVESAARGYKDINLLALQCLDPGGILVTCSCSQHVDDLLFFSILNSAAVDAGRAVQVIERCSQATDHPVTASCPETRYLKCFVCRAT